MIYIISDQEIHGSHPPPLVVVNKNISFNSKYLLIEFNEK